MAEAAVDKAKEALNGAKEAISGKWYLFILIYTYKRWKNNDIQFLDGCFQAWLV